MTVPGDSIYSDKFIREVSGNNAIYYFVKHKQPVISSTLEETTPFCSVEIISLALVPRE